MVLELTAGGFYAEPQEDGTVRITIPDFAELGESGSPSMPVKRTWVEVLAGRKVKLVSVTAREVEAFSSLRPSDAETPEIVATRDGTCAWLAAEAGGQQHEERARHSNREGSTRPRPRVW